MGTTAHVLVEGGPASCIAAARDRVLGLEELWSRFRPESEISRLNRDGWARVSPETEALIAHAKAGWEHTGGRFDPTVHQAMLRIGYDRDLRLIEPDGSDADGTPGPTPGCLQVETGGGVARLPAGVGFDPGGIGKGFAADVVAQQLLADGADAVLVNIGGDLRAAGQPEAGAWGIRIDEPAAEVDVTVTIAAGAVATSTPLRRTWRRAGVDQHHLIDPGSGSPMSQKSPALVSVVAAEAWWAEVCTKAAMLTPPALLSGLLDGAAALVVDRDGTQHLHNGMEDYLR